MTRLDFRKQSQQKRNNICCVSTISLVVGMLMWFMEVKSAIAKVDDSLCYIQNSSGLTIDLTSFCGPDAKPDYINPGRSLITVSGSKTTQCQKLIDIYKQVGEVNYMDSEEAMKTILAKNTRFSKSISNLVFPDKTLSNYQAELIDLNDRTTATIRKYLDARQRNDKQTATSIYNSAFLSLFSEDAVVFSKISKYCQIK